MASVRGNILKWVLRMTNNLNPIKNPNCIQKIKKYSSLLLSDKTPRGFVLSKETTPSGTKFERVVKKGAEKSGKVLLFFHGGAYVGGLLSTYRNFAVDFYKNFQTELILLDYKLAPEFVYPSQLDEALDLWQDLIENQGYEPSNIIVGGDSAGGNLTLAFLLKLRDENKPLPKVAFCMSPWTDMTASGESYVENYSKDVMFGEKNKQVTPEMKETFLNSEIYCFAKNADRTCPYVSPVYGEYHGFPPIYFTVGGEEMLLNDTLVVVEKLKKCGVTTVLEIQEDMFHTYPIYAPFLPEGVKSLKNIIEFIKNNF